MKSHIDISTFVQNLRTHVRQLVTRSRRPMGAVIGLTALTAVGLVVLLSGPGAQGNVTAQNLNQNKHNISFVSDAGATPTDTPADSTPDATVAPGQTATPTQDPGNPASPTATPTNTPSLPTATPTDTPTPPPSPTATPYAPSWHLIGTYSGTTTGTLAVIHVVGIVRITWTCELAKNTDRWMVEFLLDGAGGGSTCQYYHWGDTVNIDVSQYSGAGFDKDYTLSCAMASGTWNATVEMWY